MTLKQLSTQYHLTANQLGCRARTLQGHLESTRDEQAARALQGRIRLLLQEQREMNRTWRHLERYTQS